MENSVSLRNEGEGVQVNENQSSVGVKVGGEACMGEQR